MDDTTLVVLKYGPVIDDAGGDRKTWEQVPFEWDDDSLLPTAAVLGPEVGPGIYLLLYPNGSKWRAGSWLLVEVDEKVEWREAVDPVAVFPTTHRPPETTLIHR